MYAHIDKKPRVRISPNVVSTRLLPTHVFLRVYSPRSSTTNDLRSTSTIYDSTNPSEYSVRFPTLYYKGVGGIISYCHAFQFILRRYAADRYIDRAVEEFKNVRQKDDEDETAHACRLRSKAKCFGGVYSETDLIARFIRGLGQHSSRCFRPSVILDYEFAARSMTWSTVPPV